MTQRMLAHIYRILKAKRWFMHQRSVTQRPRVQGRRCVAGASNRCWAMNLTHVQCGEDGGGHLAAIIDCYDREIVGLGYPLLWYQQKGPRLCLTAS